MNMHDEIAVAAYELYEKSGFIEGRDFEDWLEAERMVLARHASQELEEPEETAIPEEAEEREPAGRDRWFSTQGIDETEGATVAEEIEGKEPIVVKKRGLGFTGFAEKIMPAKKGISRKEAAL